MENIPKIKVGVVAVSRDCFPESLSVSRRSRLVKAYEDKYGKGDIYECPICIVESEIHMKKALEDVISAGCNGRFAMCFPNGSAAALKYEKISGYRAVSGYFLYFFRIHGLRF